MGQKPFEKGRGAQINIQNKFEKLNYTLDEDYLEFLRLEDEDPSGKSKTKFTIVHPKSIVNKIHSPDIGPSYSLNPYQGCEHGCTYCYARNSHQYWGFSAGIDFEKNILVKQSAPELLEKLFQKKSWEPETIMLSGNTDCYQPAERKFKLTRQILELCLKYQHPVGIITKNSLILRDLDILIELNKLRLININFSINSLQDDLRRLLEPRTATAKQKLKSIEILSANSIPVNVMIAPIIPGLNSHEILKIAETVSKAGALSIAYTMVRLNGQLGPLFLNWLNHSFPTKKEKVKHLIESCHNGNLNDSDFGRRMSGSGATADQIHQMVKLARRKYFNDKSMPKLDKSLFIKAPRGQLPLF